MKRINGMVSVGVACLALVACGDSFGPDSVSGTYDLTSVNGTPMPATITVVEEGVSIQLAFEVGTLTLNANLTYLFSVRITVSGGGFSLTETDTDSGTYVLEEQATIRFTSTDGSTATAAWAGESITVISEVETLIFEK